MIILSSVAGVGIKPHIVSHRGRQGSAVPWPLASDCGWGVCSYLAPQPTRDLFFAGGTKCQQRALRSSPRLCAGIRKNPPYRQWPTTAQRPWGSKTVPWRVRPTQPCAFCKTLQKIFSHSYISWYLPTELPGSAGNGAALRLPAHPYWAFNTGNIFSKDENQHHKKKQVLSHIHVIKPVFSPTLGPAQQTPVATF